ncbi:MAG: hypothetical protein OHK93_000037 [Ramalina farinacea]|uniref:Uncharacterized protein n=1 Tax=Ramalina farinacea TaxID=258253 RepID=A0AA43QE56_9LECA|nr:hypothetical protein [Ramalina farinacea]
MFPFATYAEPLYPLIPSPNTSLPGFSTAIAHILVRAQQNSTIFSVRGEGVSYRISLATAVDDAAITKGCAVAAESDGSFGFSGLQWAVMSSPLTLLLGALLCAVVHEWWNEDPRRKEERLRMKRHEERMRKHQEEIELKRYIENGKTKRELEERNLERDMEDRKARKEAVEQRMEKEVEEHKVGVEEEANRVKKELQESSVIIEERANQVKKELEDRRIKTKEGAEGVRREVEGEIADTHVPMSEDIEEDEEWCDIIDHGDEKV